MSTRTGPGDGDWSEPVALKPLNSLVADGAISMTADGQTFYFATNRETMVRNDIGIWSAHFGIDGHLKLMSLPKPIGTNRWESQPAISADGKKLFFVANREFKDIVHIFVSHLLDDGNWTDPVNLGSKINAGRYDGSPFLASDGKKHYTSPPIAMAEKEGWTFINRPGSAPAIRIGVNRSIFRYQSILRKTTFFYRCPQQAKQCILQATVLAKPSWISG